MKKQWKQAVIGLASLFSVSACTNMDHYGPFGPTEPEVIVKDPDVHSCDPAVNPEKPTSIYTGYYGQRICMGEGHYKMHHTDTSSSSGPFNLRVNVDVGIPYRIPGLNRDIGNMIAYPIRRQAARYFRGHEPQGYDFRHSPNELVYHQCRPENKGPDEAAFEDVNTPGTYYCLTEEEARDFMRPR